MAPNGDLGVGQSTSLASAYAAGVVVALRSYRPDLSVAADRGSAAWSPRRWRRVPCRWPRRHARQLRSGAPRRRRRGQAPAPCDPPDPRVHVAADPQRAKDASRSHHQVASDSKDRARRCASQRKASTSYDALPRDHDQVAQGQTRDHSLRRQRPRAIRPGRRPPDETSRVDATRALWVGLACVACALALSRDLAHAGTYEVLSCGASSGINRSWVPLQRRSGQSARRGQLRLDPRRRRRRTVRDGSHPWPAEYARRPRSRLAHHRADRDPNHPSDGPVLPGTDEVPASGFRSFEPPKGNVLQSCVPPGGQTTCERGATPYSPFGPADSFAVDTAGLDARRTLCSPERAVRHRGDAPSRLGRALRCSRPGDRHRVANDPGDERRTVARRISPRRGEPRDQCHRQRRHSCHAPSGRRSTPRN